MLTLSARGPEDLLAAVPVILGFEPEESVVMLTFGGRHTFHARVDLPPVEHEDELVDLLLAPARRHGVRRVALALYADTDRHPGWHTRRLARRLVRAFEGAGIPVIACLGVRDRRWFDLVGRGSPEHGVPFDPERHLFRAQAVVEGEVIESSRSGLAARIARDAAAAALVAPHLATQRPCDGDAVAAILERCLAGGAVPDDRETARLLLGLAVPQVRDRAWWGMTRASSRERVRLWTDVTRRAPSGHAADVAAVLAFSAWMAGDGALAWCAVDRCREEQPDHSLAALVDDVLTAAVPPAELDWPAALDPVIADTARRGREA